ncbi:DUF3349 domain-containing protein [Nocardia sp. NPDC052001]|uniref:DUF3349 domain-containing protein n=1 Tax=Nocardia sp. NPDC052001 TaxID=3154853 RepID=UPI00341D09A7
MALSGVLARILAWLRAGYPQGVPDTDYIPLLSLLAQRLPEDEVRQVADALVRQGAIPADKIDAGVGITKVTDDMPSEADIARVRAHLLASGWPVDDNWNEPGNA